MSVVVLFYSGLSRWKRTFLLCNELDLKDPPLLHGSSCEGTQNETLNSKMIHDECRIVSADVTLAATNVRPVFDADLEIDAQTKKLVFFFCSLHLLTSDIRAFISCHDDPTRFIPDRIKSLFDVSTRAGNGSGSTWQRKDARHRRAAHNVSLFSPFFSTEV